MQLTKFISFPETRLRREELVALRGILILVQCRPDAVLLGRAADAGGEFALDVGDRCGQSDVLAFDDGELFGGGLQQRVDGPLPPAGEGGVVHGDFSGRVEDVPGLDLDGEGHVDGRKEELEAIYGGGC